MSHTIPYLVFGLPTILWCNMMRKLHLLRIYGEENIPDNPQGIMFVSNHPSKFLQPLLLLGLFSKFFRNNPEKYVPRIAADIDNFVRNPIFRYTRASDWFIPVNRRNKRGDNSLQIASEVADKGWNQLWFPGGTRDWKNTATVISRHGKSMGMFKRGFAKVAHEKNLPIIPIWYERKGFIVYIVIGERLYFDDEEVEVIVHRVEQSILGLADTVP